MRCSAYEGCQEGRDKTVRFSEVSFLLTLIARSATQWSGVARASAGSWLPSGAGSWASAPSRGVFLKGFFSFSFLFLRSLLRAVKFPARLIGVAACSCVGPLAPRTSSYPDS